MHEAIAEALLCGNTEVKLDSLPGYVEGLYSVMPDDESETTNVELQFKVHTCTYMHVSVMTLLLHMLTQRLALERNDPHRWTTANKDANKTKNRFVNVLPCKLALLIDHTPSFVYMCTLVADDSSRVSLEYKPGVDGSDYINASHVDVSIPTPFHA